MTLPEQRRPEYKEEAEARLDKEEAEARDTTRFWWGERRGETVMLTDGDRARVGATKTKKERVIGSSWLLNYFMHWGPTVVVFRLYFNK